MSKLENENTGTVDKIRKMVDDNKREIKRERERHWEGEW